jgi:hypothetical protein
MIYCEGANDRSMRQRVDFGILILNGERSAFQTSISSFFHVLYLRHVRLEAYELCSSHKKEKHIPRAAAANTRISHITQTHERAERGYDLTHTKSKSHHILFISKSTK